MPPKRSRAAAPKAAAGQQTSSPSQQDRLLKLADRVLAADDVRALARWRERLPSPSDIRRLVDEFLEVLFPGAGRLGAFDTTTPASLRHHVARMLDNLNQHLEEAVYLGLHRRCAQQTETPDKCLQKAKNITAAILEGLPGIRSALAKDVAVAFESDPAATGHDEIVACYPGLYAIAIFRVAHLLLNAGSEIVPRMMTEHAHSRTGIDIHPGAEVGDAFFIDHGTGIVIGETTVIGNRVRIYQGVTLGALSVRDRGKEVARPRKRHPTIEDDVIIYANATILGGNTVIGKGAVVGGNAWITYSVPSGVRVGVGT